MSPERVRVVRQVVALLRETVRAGKSAGVAAPVAAAAVVVIVVDVVAHRVKGEPLQARARGRRVEGDPGRPCREELDLVSGRSDEWHGKAAIEVVSSSLVDLEDAIERLNRTMLGSRYLNGPARRQRAVHKRKICQIVLSTFKFLIVMLCPPLANTLVDIGRIV